ncbi:hypothetical protein San01_72040 [Streptomyces angustmyceticus]|uniref:Uncharacterized protein n=1 Tax=Streptomyces angustmyceticus TaxID=285578 RepID=A0A5J4LT74_9ACTN|nr:hypothetical protein San01_72040 [Streptomyces angustmyceticus]
MVRGGVPEAEATLPEDTTSAAAANAVMRVRLILHTLQKIARFRSGRSLKRGPAGEKPPASHIRLSAVSLQPQATSDVAQPDWHKVRHV